MGNGGFAQQVRYPKSWRRGALTGAMPLSYRSCYNRCMASTITFRPDDETRLALEELTGDGTPVSTAVREALVEAAARHVKARLRAEAEALAADAEDRAEAARVLRDMEELRAW